MAYSSLTGTQAAIAEFDRLLLPIERHAASLLRTRLFRDLSGAGAGQSGGRDVQVIQKK